MPTLSNGMPKRPITEPSRYAPAERWAEWWEQEAERAKQGKARAVEAEAAARRELEARNRRVEELRKYLDRMNLDAQNARKENEALRRAIEGLQAPPPTNEVETLRRRLEAAGLRADYYMRAFEDSMKTRKVQQERIKTLTAKLLRAKGKLRALRNILDGEDA